jgi:flap endonuclease-1
MIRQHWEATRFTLPEHDGTGNWTAAKSLLEKPSAAGKAGESDGEGKGKMEGPSNLGDVVMGEKGEDAVDETIDRITSTIDTLTSLVSRYRAHNRPRERGLPETPEVSQAIEHICDLEELSEEIESQALSLPAAATEADAANTPDEGEGEGGAVVKDPVREFVDERIEEVMPNTFAESRRQSDLTVEEGEIIDAFLCRSQSSPPTSPTPPAHLSAGSVDVIVGGEEVSSDTIQITPLSQQPPLDRLDDLILRLPAIQAIYDRALDMPTQQDHADCRELLMRMGVPVIHAEAPYEAEGLASALAREGLVDYVGTEDSDVIAYEVGSLLDRS